MGERRRRMHPRETVAVERQRLEEGGGDGQREDRRAEIVHEAGTRDRGGTEAAADRRLRFDDAHAPARARERDAGRQAVGAGADDDGVEIGDGGRLRMRGVSERGL
jgi:hypothetical protein